LKAIYAAPIKKSEAPSQSPSNNSRMSERNFITAAFNEIIIGLFAQKGKSDGFSGSFGRH